MKIHMVKKGESLYQIAQKYHVDLDKLIEMNPQIADPNVIDVGMKVKIPNAPKPVEPPTDYLYKHTVVQGDTLWKLSKAWNIPLNDLIAANPQLKNPNVLMTGDIVYIPKSHSHHQGGHHMNPGQHGKKSTAPIQEVPTPLPAPVPEMPEPNVEMPVMPNVNQQPSVPEIQSIPEQPMPVMPNVNQQPFVPEIQSIPQQPMPVMPNVNQQPFVPEIQSIPQMPAMPNVNQQPYTPEIQSIPQMPAMPNMNQQPYTPEIQSIPQMPAMPNMNEHPFVSEAQSMPQMPQMPMMPTMPTMPTTPTMPTMPTTPTMPTMPNMNQQPFMPYSAEHEAHPFSAMPFGDNVFGAGQEASPNMPFGQQPSANLFEQFQVPAAEVMSFDHQPMSMWPQNEPEMPHMAQMPMASHMPYQNFAPVTPYPIHHAGGCGCGGYVSPAQVSPAHDHGKPFPYAQQMESPFMAQAAQQPYMPMSMPMSMPYSNVPYPTAVGPAGEEPCYPYGYDPRLFGAAYPGPVYPMYGHPMSPYGDPYAGIHDAGQENSFRDLEQDQQENGDLTAGVSQKTEKPAKRVSKKKRSSAEVALNRLIQSQRRARTGSLKPKAKRSPWINV
ncbi:LysM peptidoglycan-binding domain-containing protein [Paenibacillus sp. H1-7]|uniref:LysM peptidoglycan-binding domain-containing protein n=1 Tax=Paenibacillus sp. H1-7 TaxID=2282849 RepID=UPI001EF7DED0|nr:LysM domain-containing protein [Paenibacillus sp. H1-7]ULL17835.1 LysM peptidoglycan-binding domain-containing protein [Paenibacillus sp. H1-7]